MQHRPRHTGSARDHGLNVGNGEDQQRTLCASGSRLHHSNARRDHPDRPSNSDSPAAMMPLLVSFIGLSKLRYQRLRGQLGRGAAVGIRLAVGARLSERSVKRQPAAG
jgi:hypothetical protein